MLRFRGYRETESPEPLELIVVSTYRGMAGMDAFHDAVQKSGASLGGLYGRIIPWEKQAGIIMGSESGRFLVSNGWHYFRIIGVTSLGDWHRYGTEGRAQPWSRQVSLIVAESKQAIVAPLPELSVR